MTRASLRVRHGPESKRQVPSPRTQVFARINQSSDCKTRTNSSHTDGSRRRRRRCCCYSMKSVVLSRVAALAAAVLVSGSSVAALSESEIIAKEIEWMKKSLRYYQHGFGQEAQTLLSRDLLASYGDQLFEIPGPAPRPPPSPIAAPVPPTTEMMTGKVDVPGLSRRLLRGKIGISAG
jgi:hypothetical protein